MTQNLQFKPRKLQRLTDEQNSVATWLQQAYNIPRTIAIDISAQHRLGGPLFNHANAWLDLQGE